MPIKPIAAPRLYQRIAEEIGHLIDAGTFAVGARLPAERELASQLQVSRSSLREALSALELQGRVEIRVGSGVYVSARRRRARTQPPSSSASPFEISRARRLIEGEAAALAARHATPAQIKAIRKAFTRLAADLRARKAMSPADREFHLCIAQASGNAALAQVIAQLWDQRSGPLDTRMDELFVFPDDKRDKIGEYREVLDAIVRRDPAGAKRAMRGHLESVARQWMASLSGRA